MTSEPPNQSNRIRRLIEDWLPIAELSEESVRERRSMTALPATYYLHVWFARRPLVASRAAILCSLLNCSADKEQVKHALGIHGDPVASRLRIAEAKASGVRFEGDAYSYARAFTYLPSSEELESLGLPIDTTTLLDPTAGGGSIPFEALRLGCSSIGNDLNPVAAIILKATCELPLRYGSELVDRYKQLAAEFVRRRDEKLNFLYPDEPIPKSVGTNWLWARTIICPRCGGKVPLSPHWKLSGEGLGLRLHPDPQTNVVNFEVVDRTEEQSRGTVKEGVGECPFPECQQSNPTIEADEIKRQAQAGDMGYQLYAIVYRQEQEVPTKGGRSRKTMVQRFRAPRPEDHIEEFVRQKVAEKMPEWQARNIVPVELVPDGHKTNEPKRFGTDKWIDLFNPRQLYAHCASVETFHDLVDKLTSQHGGCLSDLDRSALLYVAIVIDKMLNYNSAMCVWIYTRGVVANTFNRHDFAFAWSHAEMAVTTVGIGSDWAIEQTGKSLRELHALLHGSSSSGSFLRLS